MTSIGAAGLSACGGEATNAAKGNLKSTPSGSARAMVSHADRQLMTCRIIFPTDDSRVFPVRSLSDALLGGSIVSADRYV